MSECLSIESRQLFWQTDVSGELPNETIVFDSVKLFVIITQ